MIRLSFIYEEPATIVDLAESSLVFLGIVFCKIPGNLYEGYCWFKLFGKILDIDVVEM